MRYLSFILLIIFTVGCATTSQSDVAAPTDMNISEKEAASGTSLTVMPDVSRDAAAKTDEDNKDEISSGALKSEKDKAPPIHDTSLLKSDQAILSEQALNKILSSRVVLPSKGHLAITQYPGSQRSSEYFGRNYWRSEKYLKTQQDFLDTLSDKLSQSDRIVAVTFLPSLLTPKDATIPVLREAAVRLQADLLLAFRITSDIYHETEKSVNNRVKAFSICEAVLMDTRTGLIPYTSVSIGENTQEIKTDMDISEAQYRVEKEAVLASLNVVAHEITEFLRSVP